MSKLENTLRECHRFYSTNIHHWKDGNLYDPRLWTRTFYEALQNTTDSGWRTETAQDYKDEKKKDANGKPLITKDALKKICIHKDNPIYNGENSINVNMNN